VGTIAGVLAFAVIAFSGDGARAAPSAAAHDASPAVEFNRDIRPILSDHCFQCHGPDAAKRKANLRLDQESSAKADREGGPAIVPGDLEASELYRRITAEDASARMPPVKSGKSLTAAQIDRIGRWISSGANWQAHWSFIPPRRPQVPRVLKRGQARNPIDAFILARLEQQGLAPAAEAQRGILLRRVTLDLTGLPPSRVEFLAFENDQAPNAYERMVDRLLASPRLGERLATRWLNAARYADTSGYQTDGPRIMWRWRDWVIDAFNRDLPFDQFTIEQLAGDMFPSPTLDQKIATGFNRNHRGNSEGGIIPEEYAVEYVVDRVDTTATVWLGMTLACARCHNHKFDPFTQEDFYKFFAFFNNVPEHGRAIKLGNSPPMIKAPTRADCERLESLHAQLARLKQQARSLEPEVASAQAAWESSLRDRPPFEWVAEDRLVARFPLDGALCPIPAKRPPEAHVRDGQPIYVRGIAGSALTLDGRAYLDAGDLAGFGFLDKFTLSAWVKPAGSHGGTIVSRTDDEPEGEGYSVVLDRGKIQVNLVKRWLDDAVRVETAAVVPAGKWSHVAVTYDGSRLASGVKVFLNAELEPLNVLLDELNQTFHTKEPLRFGAGGGPGNRYVGAIDEPSVHSAALPADAIAILATSQAITEIVRIPPASRGRGQVQKLRACFLATEAPASVRDLHAQIDRVETALTDLSESIPTTMVMQELPAPRATHLLFRGQYDQPGPRVEPGIPAALSPSQIGGAPNRLDLARWLVEKSNPLTARVAVNRDWQMLFGTALVRTVDDFGAQGEPPSHPELLDWLATEFVGSGWDVKKLLRLIVTSATYRQQAHVTALGLQRDPENRLLARGPRLRLPAEMIRDQALALAGLLVERSGGPSVKPYQPPGLWNELADADYVQDHGANLYRRSIYTFWKRTVPPPAMVAFDAPGRETCFVRETRTNTPLQALDVLNDVTYVEAARAFAERMIKEFGTAPEPRLAAAFHAATARRPRPKELAVLLAGFRDQLARFTRDPTAASALVSTGESTRDPRLDACELAAYTAMAQLILNLDETITKE
jgi:mono/diheme cytochrome c family protein